MATITCGEGADYTLEIVIGVGENVDQRYVIEKYGKLRNEEIFFVLEFSREGTKCIFDRKQQKL